MSTSPLELLRAESRTLLFGVVCIFFSSPGQTFFIAVFVASFGAGAGLEASELGVLYLAGTLGAAAALPALGHWIDRIDLRLYTGLTVSGLAIACLSASLVVGPVSLLVAFFLLRLFGQGLMIHVAVTSISRHFSARRGVALSWTAMGMPVATALTPPLAVLAISLLGWRLSYAGVGALVLVVALPVLIGLIAGRPDFASPPARRAGSQPPRLAEGLLIVARTRYFWLSLPVLLFMPFASTALIFHIEFLGLAKGWSRDLVAAGFSGFALGHAGALVLAGIAVDRLSARMMVPLMNIPFFASIAILALFAAPPALFAFLTLLGGALGLVQTTMGAVWAEVYGTRNVGTIRSLAGVVIAVGSAVGPAVLGLAFDFGLAVETTCWALLAIGLAATIAAAFAAAAARPAEDAHG
jgi:MFS family permease